MSNNIHFSERFLNKMLPRGCDLGREVTGGKVAVSGYDVAAALGFGELSPAAYYLGRAKYCDDNASLQEFAQYLREFVSTEFQYQNWKATDLQIAGIAQLVINEAVFGVLCSRCKGLGYNNVKKGSLISRQTCGKCSGFGVGYLSQRRRSQMTNIPLTSWIRTWEARIQVFYDHVYELDREILFHLKQQLKE